MAPLCCYMSGTSHATLVLIYICAVWTNNRHFMDNYSCIAEAGWPHSILELRAVVLHAKTKYLMHG
jgi:hypothetical protein